MTYDRVQFGQMLSDAIAEIDRLRGRKQKGKIRIEIALKLFKSEKTIESWEHGRIPPNMNDIYALAEYIFDNRAGSPLFDEDWFERFFSVAGYPEQKSAVNRLFGKSHSRQELFSAEIHPEPDIITNVWFLDKRVSLLKATFSLRHPDTGTLTIWPNHAAYQGRRKTFTIQQIRSVNHVHMPGDINNNWVEVVWFDDESETTAYFANASKLGWGNVVGGSQTLYTRLLKLVPIKK